MKLKAKLRLSFLVIGLIPLALTGVLCYRLARDRWLANLQGQLATFAAEKEQQITNLLRQNGERLGLISSRTQLRDSLAAFLQDPNDTHRLRMIRILEDAALSSSRIRQISVLNLAGTVVASSRPGEIGLELGDEEYFRVGRERNIAHLLVVDAEHHPRFYLAGPLAANGKPLGVLVIEARADELLALLRDRQGLGETGEALLVERDEHGNALVLTPLRHDAQAVIRRVVSRTETNSPVILAIQQQELVLPDTRDERDVPVLAATRYLPHPRWGLVVKLDRAEALAPVLALRNICLLAALVTLLVIILISFLVARSITTPLSRLTETAARISSGDLNRRAAVTSRDEIGVLAQSFNEMAQSLTDANKSLEAKVRERTAALEREIGERRQTEVTLGEERNRLRTLIDNTPDTIYVKDLESRFLIANAAVARLMGVAPDRLLGQTDAAFHPAELAERYREDEQQVMHTGEALLGREEPVVTHLGEWRWYSSTKVPLRDATGRIVGLVGIGRDITEHRRAEEALHRAEAKYRLLVEQLPAITYIAEAGPQGRWFFVSPQIATILGYSPEEWIAQPELWQQSVHPADRARVVAEEAEAVAARDQFRAEYRMRTRDGRVIWVRDGASLACEEANGPLLLHGVLYDITEGRRAEEALRASEEQLYSIIDTARDAYLAVNTDGRVVDWNRQAETVFGWSHKEVIGKSLWDTILPTTAQAGLEQGLAQDVKTGSRHILNRRLELTARHKDGHAFPVEAVIWALRVGQTQRFNAFVHDISERKAAEARLRESAAALARSNKELELFAYVASHDLQEPLRAVAGCVDILEKDYRDQLDAQGQKLMRHTVDGARRMQRLINDLLQYSRVDLSGQAFEPVECETIFKLALDNLSVAIQESAAVVTHSPLPRLRGDATQLMQLFQNLLGNAIKYRAKDRPPRVQVGVERKGDEWRFTVGDNGIGIDRQFYSQIFGVFQRLHTRQEYEGTGIGLAVCKKIVERHGGAIGVESELGQGSTFWFRLPVLPEPGAEG